MATTVARVRSGGIARAQLRKQPREQWTKRKQAAFLAELAATANVAASCRAVKMSDKSVYRLRSRSAEFRQGWEAALREGYARLEIMMLERSIRGTLKPVFHGGKQVAKVREISDQLGVQLLRQHASTVKQAGPETADEDLEALREALVERLQEMATRMAGGDPDPAG